MAQKRWGFSPIFIVVFCVSTFPRLVGSSSIYTSGIARVVGSILHFEFPRSECVTGSFMDTVVSPLFGSLVRNVKTTCPDGLGVSYFGGKSMFRGQVVSDEDSTAFLTAMNSKTSFTIEIWKQDAGLNSQSPLVLPVLTIGSPADTPPKYQDCVDSATATVSPLPFSMTVYDKFDISWKVSLDLFRSDI
jgi:hypothetical protein